MSSYLLVQHKVRDFAEWKRGYDEQMDARVHAGLIEKHLLRRPTDQNEIVLLFEARSLARATAFVESAALRETMEKMGVLGRPTMTFLDSE